MEGKFDLVIIGGGMVGAAVALSLADTQLNIALLERNLPEAFNADQPMDLRVSALSPASIDLLDQLGAWPSILSWRACPYQRMRVWEMDEDAAGIAGQAARNLATEFSAQEISMPELGYIVENRLVQRALLDQLSGLTNITLITDGVERIDYSAASTLIELESGKSLMTPLVIAADGGQSMVRDAAALGAHQWDYEQMAMVINVETLLPQQDITWQQFHPSGPRALLPLPGSNASLVWYDAPERIQQLMSMEFETLKATIEANFPNRLGGIKSIQARASFPLRRLHAQRYVEEGVALLGDAAHQINPLAGQGVNLGFQDVAAFSEVIHDALSRNESISSVDVLKRYEQKRRKGNLLMMQTMDLFYRLFSNQKKPLKLARNLLLGLAGAAKPARVKALRIASGIDRL